MRQVTHVPVTGHDRHMTDRQHLSITTQQHVTWCNEYTWCPDNYM